jgi:hypothetical protein
LKELYKDLDIIADIKKGDIGMDLQKWITERQLKKYLRVNRREV